MKKIVLSVLIVCVSYSTASGIEVKLEKEQVNEYRAIEAETRAINAETALSLQQLAISREKILSQWKALTGEGLEGWTLDLKAGKLLKEDKGDIGGKKDDKKK